MTKGQPRSDGPVNTAPDWRSQRRTWAREAARTHLGRHRLRPVHPADRGDAGRRDAGRSGRRGRARSDPGRPVAHDRDGRGARARPPDRAGARRPPRAALHRARRAPRAARRPGGTQPAAGRRPRLHGAGLPAGHARGRRDPAGRLRAAAVGDLLARLGGVDRDRRLGRALRPARRGDPERAPGERAAEGPPLHAPDPCRSAARAAQDHRDARRAARVGVRALEVARRLRAPARRRGRPRGLPRARPAARRDRARLALGDAIQHVGVQPAPVPGRARVCRARCARTACARSSGSRPG